MRRIAQRVQALESLPARRISIVIGAGKEPEQVEREVAALMARRPKRAPVIVIDR